MINKVLSSRNDDNKIHGSLLLIFPRSNAYIDGNNFWSRNHVPKLEYKVIIILHDSRFDICISAWVCLKLWYLDLNKRRLGFIQNLLSNKALSQILLRKTRCAFSYGRRSSSYFDNNKRKMSARKITRVHSQLTDNGCFIREPMITQWNVETTQQQRNPPSMRR